MAVRVLFTAVGLWALAGCGISETEHQAALDERDAVIAAQVERIEELDEEVTAQADRLEEAGEALGEVRTATSSLADAHSAVEDSAARFGYEDWRYVVPDVQMTASELASAQDDVDAAAEQLETALDD